MKQAGTIALLLTSTTMALTASVHAVEGDLTPASATPHADISSENHATESTLTGWAVATDRSPAASSVETSPIDSHAVRASQQPSSLAVDLPRNTDPIHLSVGVISNGIEGFGSAAVFRVVLDRYGVRQAVGPMNSPQADERHEPDESESLTSLVDLQQAIRRAKLAVKPKEADFSALTELTQTHDVICHLSEDQYYVVIESIDHDQVTFFHPGWQTVGSQHQTLPRRDFVTQWSGFCLAIAGRL